MIAGEVRILGFMGSKKKPPYDAGFREGAVRIVVETGRSAGDVAEELGINPGTLHSWVSRWRRDGTTSSDRSVQPTAASGGGGRVQEEFERTITEARKKSDQMCQAA